MLNILMEDGIMSGKHDYLQTLKGSKIIRTLSRHFVWKNKSWEPGLDFSATVSVIHLSFHCISSTFLLVEAY